MQFTINQALKPFFGLGTLTLSPLINGMAMSDLWSVLELFWFAGIGSCWQRVCKDGTFTGHNGVMAPQRSSAIVIDYQETVSFFIVENCPSQTNSFF